MKNLYLAILSPCYGGMVCVDYMMRLMKTIELLRDMEIDYTFSFVKNDSLVQRARNNLLSSIYDYDSNITHFLFIDTDIVWNPEDVLKLLYSKKDLIGGIYPLKKYYFENVKDLTTEELQDEDLIETKLIKYNFNFADTFEVNKDIIKIRHLPTGFMMIKRQVFETMQKKMPELKYKMMRSMNGELKERELWGFFDLGKAENGGRVGEDYAFCDRWKACGGRIFASVLDKMAHIGNHSYEGAAIDKFDVERKEKD